jgi:hypothetical protein
MTRSGETLDGPRRVARLVQTWNVVARLLVLIVFSQSIFAGVLLSGESWGRTAHGWTALGLVVATLLASIAAAVTLRELRGGSRLAVMLAALALLLAIQMVVGRLSAEGENLLWLHVPLGVALVGLTVQPLLVARRLSRGAEHVAPS